MDIPPVMASGRLVLGTVADEGHAVSRCLPVERGSHCVTTVGGVGVVTGRDAVDRCASVVR